ncbi:HlyD family secretion protein [Thalassobaculum sp. OXR-137]|uniref:HlyD family secretion protein n=1 Tax=Thalassobaculum sp. OXR-137 TaxID=3100173 RepID=UPI002AC90E7A|nr:HlyD family secretion protein [Thalassobaculum sp. OXR-137]WPZ35150.1 HlyD family secretion protein [Thalassobaculum sp. OXR-137]
MDAQSPTDARDGAADKPAGGSAKKRRRLVFLATVLLVAVVGGGFWWFQGLGKEETDNAFVDGDTQMIASEVTGRVIAVNFEEGASVAQGAVLVEIESADAEARVANAEAALVRAHADAARAEADLSYIHADTDARLAEAEAARDLAQSTLAQRKADVTAAEAESTQAASDASRYQKLSRSDFASRQRVETADAKARTTSAQLTAARSAVNAAIAEVRRAEAAIETVEAARKEIDAREAARDAAWAAVREAEASLRAAKVALGHTRIVAAHDGTVTRKSVVVGQLVQTGQALGSLVFGQPWVVANFKETQLTEMRVGQSVDIEVDAYPDLALRGRVETIGRGTGAYFSLLPPENATGNYVKVVQRVPVKIVVTDGLDPARPLSLGMSVIPTVHVDGEGRTAE